MAQRLEEIYTIPHGLTSLPTYTKTTVSETLNGHRKGLPDSAWLASFVLSCQRLAFEAKVIPTDPGTSSLPAWQTALREAEAEAERLGLSHRHDPSVPGAASGARAWNQVIEPATMFAAVPPTRRRDDGYRMTAAVRLTGAQREHVESFGPYGRTLVGRVRDGDAHAVYQVAVILAADPARVDETTSLLTASATTGHPAALDLLQHSPDHLNRRLTAAHARTLGEDAKRAGFPEAALTFFECAVRFAAADPAAGTVPSPRDQTQDESQGETAH
ncbi:hypothetical protein ACRYCC_14800 [Actinomadura scrupuli]|uniref:hypothetical protein n=1 Tax=Actinomadura scrupuli TaxID=559629 RepID=UPI003D98FC2A